MLRVANQSEDFVGCRCQMATGVVEFHPTVVTFASSHSELEFVYAPTNCLVNLNGLIPINLKRIVRHIVFHHVFLSENHKPLLSFTYNPLHGTNKRKAQTQLYAFALFAVRARHGHPFAIT
jgi:hypothetical protein